GSDDQYRKGEKYDFDAYENLKGSGAPSGWGTNDAQQNYEVHSVLFLRIRSLPIDRVTILVRSLVMSRLPPGATNIFGGEYEQFGKSVSVRFECSENDLKAFLLSSPVLQHELKPIRVDFSRRM